MSGKKILALVLAIVIGVALVKLVVALLSFTFSLIIPIAVGAVIVYALYRGFNHMLNTGKRLT